jgi:hypothetical protein
MTALACAIEMDGYGHAGAAECLALLRTAGAKVEGEEKEAEAGE